MKKQLTPREKVLMVILAVLMVVCVYYYAFQSPTTARILSLMTESAALDEQILMVNEKVARMNEMKTELDAIASGEMGVVKELPEYDNSNNVLKDMSKILEGVNSYNVNFHEEEIEENTVRRQISLTYNSNTYDEAKAVLNGIYESEYRTLIKNVNILRDVDKDVCDVTVEFTYYEYKK